MQNRTLLAVAVVLFTVAVPAGVSAQPTTGEAAAAPGGHRVSAELDFFHEGTANFAALSPGFYGRFRVVDQRHGIDTLSGSSGFVLDLDVKWRGIGIAGDDDGTFRMANPYIGARAGIDSNQFTFRGGLGVTLPFTNVYEDSLVDIIGYAYGAALHGVWEAWLMLPQTFALVIPVDLHFRTEVFHVGGDAAFAAIVQVPKMGDAGDPYIAAQFGAYAAFVPIPILSVGLRFQAVLLTNPSGMTTSSEEGYLALVPFTRLNFERGFAEVRLYMNLDEPFGFAFDRGNIWALSFSGGADF